MIVPLNGIVQRLTRPAAPENLSVSVKTATRLLEVSPSTVKRIVRDGPRAQSSRSWALSRLPCEPQIAGGTYRLNITATSGSFNIWVGVN